jgi:long-chain acyl-CoA synthetase
MGKYQRHDVHKTMYDFILSSDRVQGGDAVIYNNKRISTNDFFQMIDKCAGGLKAMGVNAGDCVAICLPNIPQAKIAFYACNRLGAVVSMVHPKTSVGEFEKQLKITKPKVALLTEINYFKYKPMLAGVKKIFCSLITAKGFIGLKKPVAFEPYHSDGSDPAVYMHSGGTTGASKTAVLSHRVFNALVDNLLFSLELSFKKSDAMLAVLPMFHGFGLAVGIHLPMIAGIPSALAPMFNAKKIVKYIGKQRINYVCVIPRMLAKMLDEPNFRGETVKLIEHLYVGGDNLSTKLLFEVNKRLKEEGSPCEVQQGYGLTEMGSVAALNYVSGQVRAESVGLPLMKLEARIVDENLIEVPRGEIGELIFAGDQLMDGYLGDEETSAKSFVEIDGKRWLKTGDYMSMDEDGYLYFKDRKKRLIKISGMNAFPLEIENCAKQLPEVENCVAAEKKVEGKPYICLYLLLKEGINLDEKLLEKISEHLKRNLSHWSVPKFFVQIDEIPYTNFGKVDFIAIAKREDYEFRQG